MFKKRHVSGCLALLLAMLCVNPVNAVSGENGGVTPRFDDNHIPNSTDETEVTWCDAGKFATGYAVNGGYVSTPIDNDPYMVTPIRRFEADDCYSDFTSAKQRANELQGNEERVPVVIKVGTAQDGRVAYAKYGVILMNNSQTSATFTIHHQPNSTSKKTYVNATSQRDAALINMDREDWAYVMMSGVSGYLKLTNSSGAYTHEVVPTSFLDRTSTMYNGQIYYGYRLTRYAASATDSTSMFLEVLRGTGTSYLVHSGTADKPSVMSVGKIYHSYDGHYFYDSFMNMITDYRNGAKSLALNQSPYYNYYQYVPMRAKSQLTGATFNSYLLLNKPTAGDNITVCYSSSGSTVSCNSSYAYKYSGPQSIIYNNGTSFLKGQDNYGVNAALIYVKAALEGAYGMSTISRAKYNPFGVNANDSSPFTSATKYATVYDGIESQFKKLMSLGYVNPYDSGGRYNGSHVGDKNSGINTLYASDPNWGFKLASLYRDLDKLGGFADLNLYQLGVTTKSNVSIYDSATGNTVKQFVKNYNTVNNYEYDGIDIPFIITEAVRDASGNISRYKIVMDTPSDQSTGYYYHNVNDYGYINASDLMLINTAKSGYKDPKSIGNGIVDSATSVETYAVPKLVMNRSNTKLYDSYRTDITSGSTGINANMTFAAIREVTTPDGKYYEVITDYTRMPYRTMWMKEADASFVEGKVVVTNATSLNVRTLPTTDSESKGTIAMDRSPLVYLGVETGSDVNGNTTWYKILLNPLTGDFGYVSAAYASADGVIAPPVIPGTTTISNTLKTFMPNGNPYILGTAVVDALETPSPGYVKYTLVMEDANGNIYNFPLQTSTGSENLTNISSFNPGMKYNYDHSWYEGTIDFHYFTKQNSAEYVSLPSGTYTMRVKAVGDNVTGTVDMVAGTGITLNQSITVDSKISYQLIKSSSGILSMVVSNGDGTIAPPPVTGDSGIDMAPYSAMNMPIYENSRVTYVKHTGNTIKISGYMLEQFKNYSKKDSFWREMVFIKEDGSAAYRFNMNSSAVLNPYLNANKTLNPNGKYNYNYAFYEANINLNSVYEYWDKAKKPVSLPKGNYLVYVRMSDGKRSNLMSLRNTKAEVTLPDAFYLVPGTTDVGFKR